MEEGTRRSRDAGGLLLTLSLLLLLLPANTTRIRWGLLVRARKFLQALDLVLDVLESYGLPEGTVLLNDLVCLRCDCFRLLDEALVIPAVSSRLRAQEFVHEGR